MSSKILNVGLVQHRCDSVRQNNLDKVLAGIQRCAKQNADIVLLQELHNSLYFCQSEASEHFDLAESIPGPSTDALSAAAKDNNVVVVASLFERRAPGLYHNTAVVFECDGSIAGTYRKMHIPDDPGYYEKYYFTPGDQGFVPIQTSIGRLGVLVCWDQWYPEAARLMALNGADMLLYPTAIGWDLRDTDDERERQLQSWITIQRSHAIANGLHVISCNRTGLEPDPLNQSEGIQFWGNSFIAGPQGELLTCTSSDEEETLVQQIDLGRSESVRRAWPFMRDRRIDAFSDLGKRWGK